MIDLSPRASYIRRRISTPSPSGFLFGGVILEVIPAVGAAIDNIDQMRGPRLDPATFLLIGRGAIDDPALGPAARENAR